MILCARHYHFMHIQSEPENLLIDAIKAIQAGDFIANQLALSKIDGVVDANGARRILFYLLGTANDAAIEFFVNAMLTGAQEISRQEETGTKLLNFLANLKKDGENPLPPSAA